MPRKPAPPIETCPYCGYGTSLQVAVAARHGRAGLLRAMWCAGCRGTYLAVRRLLPEITVVDVRRLRPQARLSAQKLQRGLALSVRKPPSDGLRDPATRKPIPAQMLPFAPEFALSFLVEHLAATSPEPNGAVTTDQIAAIAMSALYGMHMLAFLRYAVSHRMFTFVSTADECEQLADEMDRLVGRAYAHTPGYESGLPAVREAAPPMLCPRCGTQRVARRSRATLIQGFGQQPAVCGQCGQRYILEWGAQVPLLVTTPGRQSPFDLARFRAGIATSVHELPAPAAVWSDEKLALSAANSALISATRYIRRSEPALPVPSIDSADLWLAAAAGLRQIHPLAYVRYAVHAGAIAALSWEDERNRSSLDRLTEITRGVAERYFGVPLAS